ncbi:serine hydrolase domain-containing protein [Parapedobacter koreensis]|uniref:CubicO group peptidase, beta-lactamase class C family n=1 Tax=Parapedobacter koreensis TaxID=332977 RepID=A0A1H7GLF4_9SPHI|nr:serine hydrolase domain-containing protein [Parapedobacter koreensis]SEK38904.1 CubicO group peptidase, beta-lactamase class C family [Parapedobacter koreensis]
MKTTVKLLITNITILTLLIVILGACTSTEKRKIKAARKQHDRDSLMLVYDAAKADLNIDEFMQRLHSRSGFNGNVLIAKKGKILYQNTFGWADYLMKDSLKITSQFELASVSKPLTATGILKLWEEGKIKLEQTVDEFFPDFPYSDVTIKQLLTHRSGLNNYLYFTDQAEIWPDKHKGMSNMDVMNLFARYKPDKYGKPDGRFFYNNTNYMILAAIIEKVTGEDFAIYMQENVFAPAGMKNTAVYSKAVYEKIPTGVVGHDRVWRRSVVQNFQDGPVGDKGTYSTVQDLFLFDRALRDGRLLKPETLDSAYAGYSTPTKELFNYGYGWRTFDPGDHKVVYHTGWWHGFRNLYIRDLEDDITIVLLTNLANGSLLHLDELYQILGMPVIRQAAYSAQGEFMAQ